MGLLVKVGGHIPRVPRISDAELCSCVSTYGWMEAPGMFTRPHKETGGKTGFIYSYIFPEA